MSPPLCPHSCSDRFWISSKTFASSAPAFLTRSRTSPSELRSSKTTTRMMRCAHQGDVEIVPLTLVEVDREFIFADDLGEAPGGGDAARGQRGEARRVDSPHLARFADQLAVAIDDEDSLGVCVFDELLDDGQDLAIILVVHHQLRVIHRQSPR